MKKTASIVAVDMGYGHRRAAYPLAGLSPAGEVLMANNYEGMPEEDRARWNNLRQSYEWFSRQAEMPIIGSTIFGIMDYFQRVAVAEPKLPMPRPTLQLRQLYRLFERGFCQHLVEKVDAVGLPLVTTFFSVAFAAEYFGFKHQIYLVACDTDVSRAWAPLDASTTRIQYFAPTERVAKRLVSYGVPSERVELAGFPLPQTLTGTALQDAKRRVERLQNGRKLTLVFAVGGAGAQKRQAVELLSACAEQLRTGRLRIVLVAGIKPEVREFFMQKIEDLGLAHCADLEILFAEDFEAYYERFNERLKESDALISKPSELVFYTALGIPLIMTAPLGSQEEANRRMVLTDKTGVDMPRDLISWIQKTGREELVQCAKNGIEKGLRMGVSVIEERLKYDAQER